MFLLGLCEINISSQMSGISKLLLNYVYFYPHKSHCDLKLF